MGAGRPRHQSMMQMLNNAAAYLGTLQRRAARALREPPAGTAATYCRSRGMRPAWGRVMQVQPHQQPAQWKRAGFCACKLDVRRQNTRSLDGPLDYAALNPKPRSLVPADEHSDVGKPRFEHLDSGVARVEIELLLVCRAGQVGLAAAGGMRRSAGRARGRHEADGKQCLCI